MAKAYLSRSGSRQKAAMVKALGQALPAMAIQEARAILAETEPHTEGMLPFPTMHQFHAWTGNAFDGDMISNCMSHDEQAALAESLAAFETMTVEQLAKLQEV